MFQYYIEDTGAHYQVKQREVPSLRYKKASMDRYCLKFFDMEPPPSSMGPVEEKEYLNLKMRQFLSSIN